MQDAEGIRNQYLHWFVVQNRDSNASGEFDREAEELATFSTSPWSDIPSDQRGTKNLKTYLANTLCKRICETFPDMQEKVKQLLQTEISKRQAYGTPRLDFSQRLAYLTGIVKTFQDLTYRALKSPGELPSDDLKLRGLTEREKIRFTQDMTENGHLHKFLEINAPIEIQDDSVEVSLDHEVSHVVSWLPVCCM